MFIIILTICAVHFPFRNRQPKLIMKYPADEYFKEGMSSLSSNSLSDAEKAFLSAIAYQPLFAPFHFYLALAYEQHADYDKAVSEYLKVTEIDPECYPAFYKLGEIYKRTEKYDQAIAMMRQAVQLNPYHINAFKELAGLFSITGDYANEEKIYAYLKNLGYEK
jgi:tetratricopeptide (TPR) repeat protein